MECPQCHQSVEDTATTCNHCGADLAGSTAAPAASAPVSRKPFDYYMHVLRNYAQFSGRARRAEYWYFVLFNLLIMIGLSIIDGLLGSFSAQAGMGLLSGIYALAVLIPSIAVAVRRLHDSDKSAWWLLVLLIPFVGGLVLLILMVLDSTPGSNRYGDNPKGVAA